MKKFSMIVALLLTLVMCVLPMSAMAEDYQYPNTILIRLSDPSISVDGVTVSMDGLAAQLALCESDDASYYQVIADLIIGGENATSAMLQLDQNLDLTGLIGGMSSAYGVNLYDVMEMSGYGDMLDQFSELMTLAQTWDLPNQLYTLVMEQMYALTVTDLGASTNENGVEMYYVQYTGDITDTLVKALELIQNDAYLNAYMEFVEPGVSMYDMLADTGIGTDITFAVDAVIGTDMTGSIIDCTLDLIGTEAEYGSSTVRLSFYGDATSLVETGYGAVEGVISLDVIDGEYAMNVGTVDYTLDVQETVIGLIAYLSDPYGTSATMVCNFEDSDTTTAFSFNLISEEEEMWLVFSNDMIDYYSGSILASLGYESEYETTYIDLSGSYALTDTGFAVNGTATVNDGYSTSTLVLNDLSADMMTGAFNISLSVDDDYIEPTTLGLSLTPADTADALYAGVLALHANDGYSDVNVAANLEVYETTVDTSAFYIDAEQAIDLMTMDEMQMQTAQLELATVMQSIMEAMATAYPAFFQ